MIIPKNKIRKKKEPQAGRSVSTYGNPFFFAATQFKKLNIQKYV